MLGEDLSGGSYSAWVVAQNAAQAAEDAWQAWADDQILMGPLYNTAPPARMDFLSDPLMTSAFEVGDHPRSTMTCPLFGTGSWRPQAPGSWMGTMALEIFGGRCFPETISTTT